MLDKKEAREILKSKYPTFKIKQVVEHDNMFVFRVEKDGPEKDMDPHYSVDRNSGKLEPIQLFRHKDGMKISRKFIGDEKSMTIDPGKVMLEHYGVKGMRWGVRKQDDGSKAKTGSSRDKSTGYDPKNPGVSRGEKRTTKKLNKAAKKADRKIAKSERYSKNLKDADAGAIKNLKPTAYARYLTSGSRASQGRYDKALKKSADRARKRVSKILESIPEDRVVVYDVASDTYILEKKKPKGGEKE